MKPSYSREILVLFYSFACNEASPWWLRHQALRDVSMSAQTEAGAPTRELFQKLLDQLRFFHRELGRSSQDEPKFSGNQYTLVPKGAPLWRATSPQCPTCYCVIGWITRMRVLLLYCYLHLLFPFGSSHWSKSKEYAYFAPAVILPLCPFDWYWTNAQHILNNAW